VPDAEEVPPDDILLQVTPALPQADVWEGLVRRENMEKWLAPRVNLAPFEGGAFELFWDLKDPTHNSTLGCTVLRYREPEEFAFTWKGPPQFDELMNQGAEPTEVHIRVSPCPEGIDVTLEHKGWKAGEAWEEARSWHFRFWETVMDRFKDFVMTGEVTSPPTRE
jgi:uncharacterized protein YndB with AHSA1/START domain